MAVLLGMEEKRLDHLRFAAVALLCQLNPEVPQVLFLPAERHLLSDAIGIEASVLLARSRWTQRIGIRTLRVEGSSGGIWGLSQPDGAQGTVSIVGRLNGSMCWIGINHRTIFFRDLMD